MGKRRKKDLIKNKIIRFYFKTEDVRDGDVVEIINNFIKILTLTNFHFGKDVLSLTFVQDMRKAR